MAVTRSRCVLISRSSSLTNAMMCPARVPDRSRESERYCSVIFRANEYAPGKRLIFDGSRGAMHPPGRIIFPHRRNGDGSYDSICILCYVTVATNEDETKLRPYELTHVCTPLRFSWVREGSFLRASLR